MSDRQDRNSRKGHRTPTGKERSERQVRAAAAAGPCDGPRQTDTQCRAAQGPHSAMSTPGGTGTPLTKPVAALLAFSVVLGVLLLHVTQGATAISLNALGGLHGHTSSSACPLSRAAGSPHTSFLMGLSPTGHLSGSGTQGAVFSLGPLSMVLQV